MSRKKRPTFARRVRRAVGLEPRHRVELDGDWLVLGSEYGSHCLDPARLSSESVVYSFGVGTDVSFDLELIDRFDVTVHAFDPTPRSIEWVRGQRLPPGFRFHPQGLSHVDGTLSFHPPTDPAHVSFSAVRAPESDGEVVEAPVRRLTTIMAELGHQQIDLLKMDIEGAEYAVIEDFLGEGVSPTQVLVEFHHQFRELGRAATDAAVERLHGAGYRIFSISADKGREYSFLRQR